MATALDRDIRKLLDRAVRRARLIAEDGARKALAEMGVEDARRPEGLSAARIELRTRLRAHSKSLGDVRAADDSITASRLVREIAYEHWHRALFARFLAENNLLIDPEHKVAVSLSELEEIASEEGRDPIELAADWAEPMLPLIFRKDDPALGVVLPPETRAGIIGIVKDLPRAVFVADDSLGWAYQFWQAEQKERINQSDVAIGADELPAVTQLFTEDYMVLFLLENTLGAWWAGKVLAADPALAAEAASEDELRLKTSPPGYRWVYLRFVREPRVGETQESATGPWRPAASAFEGWPKAAKEITLLDPCMGSGHFLVFALPILMAFRRAEEGFDERAAVRAVLADNLFGLEIDPRCTQIAAFALALASWKRLGGPEPLPRLNLACSGLAVGLGKAEFLRLAEKMADAEGWTGPSDLLGTARSPLGATAVEAHYGELDALYDLFEQAPYLGSLIDPHRALEQKFGPLYAMGMDHLGHVLRRLLELGNATIESRETAVVAHGLAEAARLLSAHFTLVATNVPYLGRSKQPAVLRDFSAAFFEPSSPDLYATFTWRILEILSQGGTAAIVAPQNWFSLKTYSKFRFEMLKKRGLRYGVWLGKNAFQEMNWWAAVTSLFIVDEQLGNDTFVGADTDAVKDQQSKARLLRGDRIQLLSQSSQLSNPDFRIILHKREDTPLLSKYARSFEGLSTGDIPRFVSPFWAVPTGAKWAPFIGSVNSNQFYGGRDSCILWEDGHGELVTSPGSYVKGEPAWGRSGVRVTQLNSLSTTLYSGEIFDKNAATIIPYDESDLPAIYEFVSSDQFQTEVRRLDQKAYVVVRTLVQVPFDRSFWRSEASRKYPAGLPKPYSNDPTQWLFDGHPRGSANPNVTSTSDANPQLVTPNGVRPSAAEHPLQVAAARLVGYRWPRQAGLSFMDCPALVEPDEVGSSGLVDADGIVPLPALVGEADAATRLRELIRAVWGPDYGEGTIRELLAAEDAKANDLGTWLADEFFDGHCRLFHQMPFIWHVWDGARGGFSALVDYHRLCEPDGAGRRLLEKLRDTYLGEWIAVQRRAFSSGEAGAEIRLIAAEHLRDELTKIIEGEPPYDIFVRWKPIYRQPIGWEPDIDDGVRLNIRPFLAARPKSTGRKDGCILRVTPRVKKHDGADRGAEPRREKEDFPWFWAEDDDIATEDFAGGPTFKGRRYNGFHYTREFKQRARDAKGGRE